MHPHSAMAEYLFGPYTKVLRDLVHSRVSVKHRDVEKIKTMLNGVLAKYLVNAVDEIYGTLAYALKIAINSIYGLTAAKFENAFHDPRNIDNIVAKRGALFMVDLKEAVEARGGKVIHIKTDSIKLEDPSDELIEFVMNFGKRYGYTFEVEHKFEKICLVNDAVYIAKLADDDPDAPGEWTATGTQFAVPYVFKTLFSKEPITFSDICETKSVNGDFYLDMNEKLPDVTEFEILKDARNKIKSEQKITRKENALIEQYAELSDEELDTKIANGHDYHFVGKVGLFCPMKPNTDGGILYRYADNKYSAATGSKGYRWMEAETVKNLDKESDIDHSYYTSLVDDAIDTINTYGDFEQFIA
jgi:hypothetical protein